MNDDNRTEFVTFEVEGGAAHVIPGEGNLANPISVASQLAQIDIGVVSAEISRVVDKLASAIRPRPGGPCQCEVAFGVKVSADAGVIISKIGGEASLNVKVVWDRT